MSEPRTISSPDLDVGPPLPLVVLAFAAVYVIWGSTYLAIRFAIETVPPFTMAGIRFLVAGGLLFFCLHLRHGRAGWPTGREWRNAAIVGGLLLLGGNGAVVWAEQWVPSGLVSLLVATVPFWMVLLDWLWAGSPRPSAGAWAGLAVGLAGVWLLVGREGTGIPAGMGVVGAGVVLAGALLWATGSIMARHLTLPASPAMATAAQMLVGGGLLALAGLATGEWFRWNPGTVSALSAWALVYLVLFGSLVAYGAYTWLLRVSTPGRVGTYAYVNPVVALLLGWALADEPLTPRTWMAAGVILGAVVVITVTSRPRRRRGSSGATVGRE